MTTPSPESSPAPSTGPKSPKESVDNVQPTKGEKSSSSSPEPGSISETDDQPSTTTQETQEQQTPASTDWQAIWSPQHNAYYFYNPVTQETTWTNPLQPTPSTSTSPPPADAPQTQTPGASTSTSSTSAIYAAAIAQGIDPALAHLDPSLLAGSSSSASSEAFTAKFNARTGAFTKVDARDPTHLSEYERAKRMSEFYFDVGAWEKDVEARKQEEEADGKKRKRPSRKDLERFKEQKKQKKIAKTAWLRT